MPGSNRKKKKIPRSSITRRFTQEWLLEQKSLARKTAAKGSFEEKFQAVIRMQHMRYELRKSLGKRAPRPWDMPEEDYKRDQRGLSK